MISQELYQKIWGDQTRLKLKHIYLNFIDGDNLDRGDVDKRIDEALDLQFLVEKLDRDQLEIDFNLVGRFTYIAYYSLIVLVIFLSIQFITNDRQNNLQLGLLKEKYGKNTMSHYYNKSLMIIASATFLFASIAGFFVGTFVVGFYDLKFSDPEQIMQSLSWTRIVTSFLLGIMVYLTTFGFFLYGSKGKDSL